MIDTRQKCEQCKGSGVDEWGGTCLTCGGQGRVPFREHGKEDDEESASERAFRGWRNIRDPHEWQ